MQQVRKWISILVLLIMVPGIPVQTFAASAGGLADSRNITLRIEFLEGTLQTTKSMSVNYRTFGDYGLDASLNDPGYITPMHVLADYFEAEFGEGAAAENMKAPGYLQSIMGSEGSIDDDFPCGWMFTVNHGFPTDESGLGYTMSNYPVKENDQITIFGIWYSFSGTSSSYYTFFEKDQYTGEAGEPIEVKLLGHDVFDFSDNASVISGATILAEPQNNTGTFALEKTSFTTGKNGIAEIVFDSPGTYVISATRKNSGGHTDISRPYGVVSVEPSLPERDRQLVEGDKEVLSLPTETSADLMLPQKGASGKTVITWQSDNETVISNTGKVRRPDAGQPPADAELTATIKKGSAAETKLFSVSVQPYTQQEVLADINQIRSALGTAFTAVESTDTNIVTAMQAKADAVRPGSTLQIVSSANSQVNGTTGAITYGSSRKTGNVTVSVELSGVSEQITISVIVPAHLKTAQEIVNEDAGKITWDLIKNSNTNINGVKSSLKSLPSTGDSYCTDIEWVISRPEVVSRYGSVTRPDYGGADVEVTLTATIKPNSDYMSMFGYGGTAAPVTKNIVITVLAYTQEEYDIAEADLNQVIAKMQDSTQYTAKYFYDDSAADFNGITGDLNLNVSSSLLNGASLSWSSTNEAISVNSYYGNVSRPAIGQPEKTGKLTATLKKSGNQKTVDFTVTVIPLSTEEVNAENTFLDRVKSELTFEKIKGTNTDNQNVISNLSMVYRGIEDNGLITWKTSNSGYNGAVISWETSDSGYPYQVTRPGVGQPDKTVTLTATVASQKIKNSDAVPGVQKQITFTVPAYSNSLKAISMSDGRLSVPFDPDITSYDGIEIPRETGSLTIEVTKRDSDATITAIGPQISENSNTYTVSMDGTPKTVRFEVKRNSITKIYTLHLYPETAALPSYTGEWESFRGNVQNNGITNAFTARTEGETLPKWSSTLIENAGWTSSTGMPLIVNHNIYITAGNEIKIISKDGSVVKTGTLSGEIGFTSNMAYGEGMIFVPIDNGRIQALNAETLESLWITESPGEGYQAGSPVIYRNGYIYTGAYQYVSASKTNGKFFCIDVKDENPYMPDEVKQIQWEHVSGSTMAGYYWTGAAVSENSVLFGGDDGKLISHPLTESQTTDVFDAQSGSIRCGILYDNGNAYFVTTTGKAFCVPVNNDGTFAANRAKSVTLSNNSSTSTPVLYNGRLYVLSGSFNTGSKLDVIDAKTMEVISNVDLNGYSQSSPLLTTAYAVKENGNRVYLYFILNDTADDIICIEDSELLDTPVYHKIYSPGGSYAASSLIADTAGTLYAVDGNFTLQALGSKKINAEGVALSETELVLNQGESINLTAAVRPANAPEQTVTWSSSNEAVVSVNQRGQIQSVSPGTAVITVKTLDGQYEDTCEITVLQGATATPAPSETIVPPTPTAPIKTPAPTTSVTQTKVVSVRMPQKSIYLQRGKKITVKGVAYTNNGSGAKLKYSSNRIKIATVTQSGVIKGLKKGTAVITAKAVNGKKATLTVKVLTKRIKLKQIFIKGAPKTIRTGIKNRFLTAKCNPGNATSAKVIWKSSKPAILAIDRAGKLTPKKEGRAVIHLRVGRKKRSVTIRVLKTANSNTEAPGITPAPAPSQGANTTVTANVISCTVSIECSTVVNINPGLAASVSNGGIILQDTAITIPKDSSVYDALRATGIPIQGSLSYIGSINHLGEGDCGPGSGWMYNVNGQYFNISCGSFKLEEGDRVQWRYTCNQGADIGANSI